MKRYLFILITMLFALSSGAQIKQEVISSAGGYSVNGGLSLSWTLGETIIPTFKSGDLVLTHGFQQQLIITSVEETFDVLFNIKIFPNPISEVLNIKFDAPVDEDIVLLILDSQGKLVRSVIIESAMVEKHINLQEIPTGIYYLRLTKGKLVNVYKVVKL